MVSLMMERRNLKMKWMVRAVSIMLQNNCEVCTCELKMIICIILINSISALYYQFDFEAFVNVNTGQLFLKHITMKTLKMII